MLYTDISTLISAHFLTSACCADLFESPEYVRHGAVLWPDYWPSSAAPDLFETIAPEAKRWEGAHAQSPALRSL